MSQTKSRTLICPKIDGIPLAIPGALLGINLFVTFSLRSSGHNSKHTHIVQASEEDWLEPIDSCSFRFQNVNRGRPVLYYKFDNRTCAIHDTAVRTVVHNKLESYWFDEGGV